MGPPEDGFGFNDAPFSPVSGGNANSRQRGSRTD